MDLTPARINFRRLLCDDVGRMAWFMCRLELGKGKYKFFRQLLCWNMSYIRA